MYDLDDGKAAIALARAVLDEHFGIEDARKPVLPSKFSRKSGVFVTLNKYPSKNLRGCIGYIQPVMELKDAIKENALNAGLKDPRFPKLRKSELDEIIVEVSLLTVPREVEYSTPEELTEKIEIGRDGLIVERSLQKGLLLPQVPVEWSWGTEEFLDHTCMKAGLSPGCWRAGNVLVKKFSATVFAEKTPRGEVEKKPLTKEGSD